MASCFKKAMEEEEDEKKQMTHKYNQNNMSHMLDKINYSSTNRSKQEMTKTLLENPDNLDVFGYDSYFDNIQKKRQEIVEQKKEKGKVRFMDSLKDAAEKRKLERSIIFEKLAHKELEKEGKEINNGERFITASYKEVLEANRKFQAEDDLKEKFNEKNSASNKSDLSAIYKTFYHENLFAGGDRIDINAKIKESNETQKKIKELKETQTITNNKNEDKNTTNISKERNKSRSRSRSASYNKTNDKGKTKTNEAEHKNIEQRKKNDERSKETEKNEKEEKIKNNKEAEKEKLLEKKRKIELAKQRFEERKKVQEGEGEGVANDKRI